MKSASKKTLPYRIVRGIDGCAHVEINGQKHSPPEIASKILKTLKATAEGYLGEKVTEAVITVPAAFNELQRRATRNAAKIAGLNATRILNEPTAAALVYGLDQLANKTIAVCNFGGGNFNISIFETGDGVVEATATAGDTKIGGDNIDQRIVDWIISQFSIEHGSTLSMNSMGLQRLKEAAEKAKIELSSQAEAGINLPFLQTDAIGPKHLLLTLTRIRLEQMCEDIFQSAASLCKQGMQDVSWPGPITDKLDELFLIGGTTRIPRVQSIAAEFFRREPNKRLNPDEAAAAGAAIQAGVLSGEVDLLCLDATSLSLGIETLGGVFTRIIERNTTLPTRKSETFTTAVDNQTSVEIKAFQGERAMAKDNVLLRRFTIGGIPPAPRGVAKIEVSFGIDSNGITITAENQGTGAVDPGHLALTSEEWYRRAT